MNLLPTENESNRDKRLIYHLTAVQNLPSIHERGLLCRRALAADRVEFRDVADDVILAGRGQFDLDGMVPFHFIPKNPFDYGVVRAYPDEEYVLFGVRRAIAEAQGWSIIPRHPLAEHAQPDVLTWAEGMEAIDWPQLDRTPRPYGEDQDCKLACMAEALCPNAVEFNQITMIFVPTARGEEIVRRVIGDVTWPKLEVNPNMFPSGCK